MEIEDGVKEDKAVAAFRQGLGSSNIDVDEAELGEVSLRSVFVWICPLTTLSSPDIKAAPKNLACTLLPHQVQSLLWLKSRENGAGKNHGGLLADDVSLRQITSARYRSTDSDT